MHNRASLSPAKWGCIFSLGGPFEPLCPTLTSKLGAALGPEAPPLSRSLRSYFHHQKLPYPVSREGKRVTDGLRNGEEWPQGRGVNAEEPSPALASSQKRAHSATGRCMSHLKWIPLPRATAPWLGVPK